MREDQIFRRGLTLKMNISFLFPTSLKLGSFDQIIVIYLLLEYINNDGLTNEDFGEINRQLLDNGNGRIEKVHLMKSYERNSGMDYQFLSNNLPNFISESLKQVEEYRIKMQSIFGSNLSNRLNSNQILNNQSIKFVQRPKTPIELVGKSNEKHLSNLLSNSIIDKSDGLFISFN
jgi:hypothetical protein